MRKNAVFARFVLKKCSFRFRDYKFEEGIERTVRWYLENGEWMDRVTSGAYADYYKTMYGAR